MPRRHGWWVIVARATPTAFRSKRRDTLVPTLRQLQRTHPDAALRWFDRGRLWESPAEASAALKAQRVRPKAPKRPGGWRPGGDHKDPRERYKLTREQKRARFKRRLRNRSAAATSSGPGRRKGSR
jgi:hypothetical protein